MENTMLKETIMTDDFVSEEIIIDSDSNIMAGENILNDEVSEGTILENFQDDTNVKMSNNVILGIVIGVFSILGIVLGIIFGRRAAKK